jgi:hypothetical protein
VFAFIEKVRVALVCGDQETVVQLLQRLDVAIGKNLRRKRGH